MIDDIEISIKNAYIYNFKKSIITLQQVPISIAEKILSTLFEGISYHRNFMVYPGASNTLALIDAKQDGKQSVPHILSLTY